MGPDAIGGQQGLSAGTGARIPAGAELALEATAPSPTPIGRVTCTQRALGSGWWPLRNGTVRCKLTVLILAIGSLAVLMELGFLILYQSSSLRGQSAGDAGSIARVLSSSAAASLSSGDRSGAEAALNAAAVERQVLSAALYDRDGKPFAEYLRPGRRPAPIRTAASDGKRFVGMTLTLTEGVVQHGTRAGTIVLVYDLGPQGARLRQYVWIILVVLVLSIGTRVAVVMRLTRMVTDPLAYLAGVAREISERRDYSLRAQHETGGEIGQLIHAFNAMVAQIERHDRARQAAEDRLRRSEERYALAARGSNDGLWDYDATTENVYLSPRLNAILGGQETERWGSPEDFFARIHPADRERVHTEFAAHSKANADAFEVECRMRHLDGSWVWTLWRGTLVLGEDGRVVRTAGSISDITKRKVVDALTGLPNRVFFLDELERALEKTTRGNTAVLFLDLDRFRMVNDSLGHGATEELLMQVTGRLRSAVRAVGRDVVVARTGEDEFAMLLTDIERPAEAEDVAGVTLAWLREPFYLEGQRLPVGASIGIAFASASDKAEDLLRNAETAMYHASTKGNAEVAIFRASMRERAAARLEIVMGLRSAIKANQLCLRYQPLISLRERRIIGFESLVRWQHPERGLLRPMEFIPIAEESDLILEVGEWVLREACRQMAEWDRRLAPAPPLTLGVNVAARQMNDGRFAELVQRVLIETGMEARRLRLEITESSLVADTGQILATLRALRQMGVQLVIDDFGTGYSSLSYLQRLPFDVLKIDRSFIRELGAGDGSPEIVRTIIQLARSFKLRVVAEGVETADQVNRLSALGCDLIQGFYFGKPATAQQTEALIRDGHGLNPAFPGGAAYFEEAGTLGTAEARLSLEE